jgi:hypothetical protein
MLCAIIFTGNTSSSLEVPADLKDKNWLLKSDEGDGSIYFYSNFILLQPALSFGSVEIPLLNLVARTTNFMAFRRYIPVKYIIPIYSN